MGIHVLLVDDEIEICRALRRLLRRFDFEVTFTVNPIQALELVRAQHFDVVISDYRMPEMDGTELLSQVSQASPRTLRLMLSACAEIDTLAATYDETQILRFIRKPWDDAEFAGNLRRLLEDPGSPSASKAEGSPTLGAGRVW